MRFQLILGSLGNEKTEFNPILRYNLKITNNRPHIRIIHSRLVTPKMLDMPTVIVERADTANLFHCRETINHPNVLAVLKISTIRDPNLQNAPTCHLRYYCTFINKYNNIIPEETRPEIQGLEKIRCLVPSSVQDRFAEYKNLVFGEKPVTIHFVGQVDYGQLSLITWHRQMAMNKVKRLPGAIVHVTKNPLLRPVQDADYLKLMVESKICLSPWGMGEWNYRDFQAMYAGCILIKPDSDHVQMYPVDIFKDLFYVRCNPDFSDLQTKFYEIMDNWDSYEEKRIANRQKLVESWDYAKLSQEFTAEMEKLYDNRQCR